MGDATHDAPAGGDDTSEPAPAPGAVAGRDEVVDDPDGWARRSAVKLLLHHLAAGDQPAPAVAGPATADRAADPARAGAGRVDDAEPRPVQPVRDIPPGSTAGGVTQSPQPRWHDRFTTLRELRARYQHRRDAPEGGSPGEGTG